MTIQELVFPERLWAGNEHNLEFARSAYNRLMAGVFDTGRNSVPAEEKAPYNYSLQGDIGVIEVKGALTNEDNLYNRYYGMTGYADIRRALEYGANDAAAKMLVLRIDSGGGAVSGVADVGRTISRINQTKSIVSFADGTMASAAYWLGCSAGSVYVSETSITGSIGVILTHKEYSAAFKAMGIGVTIMRAGEYKALANSAEPLTETARNQLQDQLNSAYQVFIGHVATARGTTINLADQKMGQGREFFGAKAVDAGLADGVESFDSLMSKLSAKLLDSDSQNLNNSINHQRGLNMGLTDQQLADLKSGKLKAEDATAIIAAAVAAASGAQNVTKTPNETVESKPQQAAAPAAATSEVVTYLQGQLAATTGKLAELQVSSALTATKLTTLEANYPALVEIAAKSVSSMKVALGLGAIDLSASSAEVVLAEHATTSALFVAKFPAGGVAALGSREDAAAASSEGPDADYLARVQATRIQVKK